MGRYKTPFPIDFSCVSGRRKLTATACSVTFEVLFLILALSFNKKEFNMHVYLEK
jgi:hypothetical protein